MTLIGQNFQPVHAALLGAALAQRHGQIEPDAWAAELYVNASAHPGFYKSVIWPPGDPSPTGPI